MRSTARKDGDDYILNGEKMWITLSNVADRFLVFAKTDTSKGAGGITAFILERGWSGLTTGTIEGKMGVHASNTGWVACRTCACPSRTVLGLEGEGFKIAMSALDNARYGVAAGAVGIMKACLEESIKYAKQRETFGKPIAEYQLVQQMLANMQQSIDAGQLLVWKAGLAEEPGHAQHAGDEHGQVVLHRRRQPLRQRRRADSRRLRLFRRVQRGAPPAQHQERGDLRRHLADSHADAGGLRPGRARRQARALPDARLRPGRLAGGRTGIGRSVS
jgi:alkylation response protein AidB-like acyl-CoA dehydrogenase